jgi:hypothetical protein
VGLSLATPALLGGLVLLGLPIAAHLTGYRELAAVEFPSLRLLRASQLKVRRRRRVESWVLLLLRIVAVIALVAAFARPSVTWTARALPGLDPSATTLVLLDTSASMQAGGGDPVLERARAEARDLIQGLGPGTLAAVLAFDQRSTLLEPGLTADRAPTLRALEDLEPGFGATDLDRALRHARQVLDDAGEGRANVFVLSDGSATTLPTLGDWPEGIQVHYHDLLSTRADNRFVSAVSVQSDAASGGITVAAEVVSTGGAGGSVPLKLALPDGVEVVSDVALEAGRGEARFTLPLPPEGTVAATLSLPPDALPVDDARALALSGDDELPVLLVSGDGGSNPRDDEVYYLDRALQPGPGSPSRIRPRVATAEELAQIQGGAGDVVFLANVADPRPLAGDLKRFVEAGGGLVLSVGNRVDPDLWNDALGDLLPARFTEVKTRGSGTFEKSPTGLSLPPMESDEFRVFRTGGASVFGRVRFGRLIGTEPRLAEASQVLLRYSDGLPALLERQVGDGRVVLLTSSLDDDWTDLPLRSIYVPLMHQLARGLSGTLALDGPREVEVGGAIDLPMPLVDGAEAWVLAPDGKEHPLEIAAADADGRVPYRQTRVPGHHQLIWKRPGREPQLRALFAVRVPEAESRLSPAGRDALLAAVPGLIFHGEGGAVGEDAGEIVRTASLVPALLGLLALMLLSEGAMVGRQA